MNLPTLQAESARRIGRNLRRPECVIARPDGTLWTSDLRAVGCRIGPDGDQQLVGTAIGTPNGLAMDRAGSLYAADIDRGQLVRVDQSGEQSVTVDRMNGHKLGALNFPYFDLTGRLWFTVSTRKEPRQNAKVHPVGDGYIARLDADGPASVVDGLFFANEMRIDASVGTLYVAETTAGRISQYSLADDGEPVGPRRSMGPDPVFPGAAVDGIALDVHGNLWITELTTNSILVIDRTGHCQVAFADPYGRVLRQPSSVAFGGDDLSTLLVGSLELDHVVAFDAPVVGMPMYHWT